MRVAGATGSRGGEDGAPPEPQGEHGLADTPTSEFQALELGDRVAIALTLI